MDRHSAQPSQPIHRDAGRALPAGSRPLMEQLRDDTHTLHKQAERQSLQTDMMRRRLPRQCFIAYLEQLYLIHQRLESHLATMREHHAIVADIIQPHHYHAPFLKQDLHEFGRHHQHLKPLAATADCLAWLDRTAGRMPLSLLGVHYVFEGSKNGGRFQAVKVREAYALEGHTGTAYLDPYRDQQSHYWTQYKSDMNRAALSEDERNDIVEAAKTTFQFFIDLCRELMAPEAPARGIDLPKTSDEVAVK